MITKEYARPSHILDEDLEGLDIELREISDPFESLDGSYLQEPKGLEFLTQNERKLLLNDQLPPNNEVNCAVEPSSVIAVYNEEIKGLHVLTIEEERALYSKILGNNEEEKDEAKRILVEGSLRWARYLAFKLYRSLDKKVIELEDLIGYANEGLIKAANKFDPLKGVRFNTYATRAVWNNMCREGFPSSRPILVSNYSVDKWRRLTEQLKSEFGREPTLDEISIRWGKKKEEIENLSVALKFPSSLDQPVRSDDGDEDLTVGDALIQKTFLDPEESVDTQEATKLKNFLRRKVRRICKRVLDERHYRVIEKRFGLDGNSSRTLRETGSELGVSYETVRIIENEALPLLKKSRSLERLGKLTPFAP